MSANRLVSLKDSDKLQALVKAHIKEDPAKSTLLWTGEEFDGVADSYQNFLAAVAQTGHRLDTVVFLQVLE